MSKERGLINFIILYSTFVIRYSKIISCHFLARFHGLIISDILAWHLFFNQAVSNTMENFKYGFENMFMDTVIKRREMNENMFARIMDDTGIKEFVMSHLLPWVYRRLRENSTARK